MKRHKTLIPLSQDHHNGLMLAQLIKEGAPEYRGLPTDVEGKVNYLRESWQKEIEPHFKNEENILFAEIYGKNQDIDLIIDELKSEHQKLERLIGEIEISKDVQRLLSSIGFLLENHIRKEERLLFEKIQFLLAEELNHLEGKIPRAIDSCKI